MKQLTISTIIILNFLPIQSSDGCFSNTRAFLRDKQLQKYVRCLDRAQQAADRYLYLLCHEYGHQDTPETLLAFATLTQAGTEAGATYYKMSDFRRQKLAELVCHRRLCVPASCPLSRTRSGSRRPGAARWLCCRSGCPCTVFI